MDPLTNQFPKPQRQKKPAPPSGTDGYLCEVSSRGSVVAALGVISGAPPVAAPAAVVAEPPLAVSLSPFLTVPPHPLPTSKSKTSIAGFGILSTFLPGQT